jgi:hypothetical protein
MNKWFVVTNNVAVDSSKFLPNYSEEDLMGGLKAENLQPTPHPLIIPPADLFASDEIVRRCAPKAKADIRHGRRAQEDSKSNYARAQVCSSYRILQ